ncbi:MAG: hypothetical protein Q8Q29_08440, partial [Actinomycetota bacterium]|nr:hypothetical protein [Actinomycetota bacterium]
MPAILMSEWMEQLPALAERWSGEVERSGIRWRGPFDHAVSAQIELDGDAARGMYLFPVARASVQASGLLLNVIGMVGPGWDFCIK